MHSNWVKSIVKCVTMSNLVYEEISFLNSVLELLSNFRRLCSWAVLWSLQGTHEAGINIDCCVGRLPRGAHGDIWLFLVKEDCVGVRIHSPVCSKSFSNKGLQVNKNRDLLQPILFTDQVIWYGQVWTNEIIIPKQFVTIHNAVVMEHSIYLQFLYM